MSALDRIREQVTGNAVVLYMKGTPQFPQCGFSSRAAQVLQACGVTDFLAVNVLADPEIFENLKYYANWPTFPQLYVKGELVGGADIVSDMHQQGELQKLLDSATG
jgi:monothiol glutaredoxin